MESELEVNTACAREFYHKYAVDAQLLRDSDRTIVSKEINEFIDEYGLEDYVVYCLAEWVADSEASVILTCDDVRNYAHWRCNKKYLKVFNTMGLLGEDGDVFITALRGMQSGSYGVGGDPPCVHLTWMAESKIRLDYVVYDDGVECEVSDEEEEIKDN
jgi:hypothetical protein